MAVELHLPDLPEVPISLGPARARPAPPPATPWLLRLRDVLSAYLPLLLMALLALGTWWLVQNTPVAPGPAPAAPVRHDPDYTMARFAIERFDRSGRLQLRIEGEVLRHYPDTDRYEIDDARIAAVAPDGRVTHASARRALGNGDFSELQLHGNAQVRSRQGDGQVVEMSSEFLHAFLLTERVTTHLPVQVRQAKSVLRAAGLTYEHGARRLDLKGPLKATLPPPAHTVAGR
jgi:lipopolysaccharide export system protein LptC